MNSDLNSEISALRNQVYVLLIALIVVSGTLSVFLYRQASITRKDLDALKPQAEQLINSFNQNQALIANFVNQLVAYGQTHPDFVPVLAKYGIAPVKGIPAGAPAGALPAAPAPATPKK
jgi:hypothetical protein